MDTDCAPCCIFVNAGDQGAGDRDAEAVAGQAGSIVCRGVSCSAGAAAAAVAAVAAAAASTSTARVSLATAARGTVFERKTEFSDEMMESYIGTAAETAGGGGAAVVCCSPHQGSRRSSRRVLEALFRCPKALHENMKTKQ